MESFEQKPHEIFYEAVKSAVDDLAESGALPERYAEGFLKRAARIEVGFEDATDAAQKAMEYIAILEPVVAYFAKWNEQELRLLALSGDIGMQIEQLGQMGFDGPKEEMLSRLADARTKIDVQISAINKQREATINDANREILETSSDEEE